MEVPDHEGRKSDHHNKSRRAFLSWGCDGEVLILSNLRRSINQHWGHHWARQKILFYCDNNTVIDIWRKGSTRCKEIMTLIHLLYFYIACYNMHIVITHIIYIAGIHNVFADAISRF